MDSIEKITVSYKNEKPLLLPVDNNTLSLSCLKEYYPSANGLIYIDENGSNGLLINDGKIILNPNINNYQVHFAEVLSKVDSADELKAARIRMYRKALEGHKIGNVPPILNQPTPPAKRHKGTDLRKAALTASSTLKIKSIFIGWKHRKNCDRKKFVHQKGLIGGTTKELELDCSLKYNTEAIINMAIKEFGSDKRSKFTLENSKVCLGLFNGVVLEHFSLVNGEDGGIWNYIAENKITGRINFYLLSTANEDFREKYEQALQQGLFEPEVSDDDIDIETRLPLYDITNNVNNEKVACETISKSTAIDVLRTDHHLLIPADIPIKKIVTQVDIHSLPLHLPAANNLKQDEDPALLVFPESNSMRHDDIDAVTPVSKATSNIKKDIQEQASLDLIEHLESVPVSVSVEIGMVRNYTKIDVMYLSIKHSSYSDTVSFFEESSSQVYKEELGKSNIVVDEENFEPVEHGYLIKSVCVDMQHIVDVNMFYTDEGQFIKEYTYGKDLQDLKAHSIIFDTDTVFGWSDNNHFRIGIISTCLSKCEPVFTWYRNGQEYKKIPMGFCIQLPIENDTVTWHCTFLCKERGTIHSKSIKVDAKIIENSTKVQEVSRSEFVISKNCLGAGSTAIVYEGQFSGVKVAVKSIKIYNRYRSLIEREIAVLKQIGHSDFFIKLYAFCTEERYVHLITEYFESCTLEDVINDAKLQIEYNFDIDLQNSICLQLCQAVMDLHNRDNYIIHKDIKSQNILINKSGQIKMCDFGLSKLSVMVTALQTTINSEVMGTKLYMAPEILLYKKRASKESDIWSLACTIVEIYKKDVVWDVTNEEDLIDILSKAEAPDIATVPVEFQDIIQRCFSYDHTNRPKVIELGHLWNTNYLAAIRKYQH